MLECTQIQHVLRQAKQALTQEGILSLTNAGEIQFITPQAEEFLNQYFPPYTPSTLPALLYQWFQHQLTQLNNSNDLLLCTPLHIEQSERQLTICLIPNLAKSQNILILEEHQSQSFSIETLELLGLTKREAEVLFWVSKDKKNIQIANELNCSKGTIRKHLENIYKKLSVQTRMGAVMTALERLGLLNE